MVQVWLRFHIGGADKGVALPGQEEKERTAGSHHVDHAEVPRAVVWGKNYVRATRAVDNRLHILSLTQLSKAICERSTCIDHFLCFDLEGLGIWCCLVDHLGSACNARIIEENSCYFRVVQYARPLCRCGESDGNVCPGVIVRTLIEDGNIFHSLAIHLRELLPCPCRAHDVGAGCSPEPKSIVELEEYHEQTGHGAQRC
mmetsp:Transcript_39543/g.60798  ORF Transcript_39543/g.60798 Transcript_39543/m.60798 type:complete len:200 (-) Transcript_39543:549-1148(-)